MSSPSAELTFYPKLNQAATRKMSKDAETAIAKATDQASAETKSQLDKAVSGGLKKGGEDGFGKLKEFGNSFAGEFGGKLSLTIAGIATAAAAVITDTLGKTLSGADEVADRLRERVDLQRQMELTGSAFGMSSGQFGALSEGAMAMGLSPEDMSAMMSGFVGTLSNPEMAKYKALVDGKGIGVGFVDLIQKAAGMDANAGQQLLNGIIGGDDAIKMGMFAAKVREMNAQGKDVNIDSLSSFITGRNVVSADITKDIAAQKRNRDAIYKNDAVLYDKHLRQQLSAQDVADINSRTNSKESVDDANRSAFHLKVEMANNLDTLTVKQLNAGKTSIEVAGDILDKMNSLQGYLDKEFPSLTQQSQAGGKTTGITTPSGTTIKEATLDDWIDALEKVFGQHKTISSENLQAPRGR